MSLDFKAWQQISPDAINALSIVTVFSGSFAALRTTTSATFANLVTFPTTLSISKRFASTRLRIDFYASMYLTGAIDSAVEYALNLGGVDYVVAYHHQYELNQHVMIPQISFIASGVAAGGYTITPRWRRVLGTGTISATTTNSVNFSVEEVR